MHYIKWTSESVRELFLERDYIVPNDWTYKTTRETIPYVCPNGHIHKMLIGNFKKGKNCLYCCNRKSTNSTEVRLEFANEGCVICKGWEYVNAKIKIPYVCSNNHHHATSWKNWKKNRRCKYCVRARINAERFISKKNLTLYWVKIYDWFHGKWCYKFGITSHTVSVRFDNDIDEWGFNVDIVDQTNAIGSHICMLEQSLLYRVKDYRAKWVPLEFDGNTECFECSEEEALHIWNEVVNGW